VAGPPWHWQDPHTACFGGGEAAWQASVAPDVGPALNLIINSTLPMTVCPGRSQGWVCSVTELLQDSALSSYILQCLGPNSVWLPYLAAMHHQP
jgi:hypothetical protein